MALLNDPASLPSPMWAVVRFLANANGPVHFERASALLSPPSLGDTGRTFHNAVDTLESLGIVARSADGRLSLDGSAQQLDGEDLDAFSAALRDAVLAPERNTRLGDDNSQVGPRDLSRALAWFLSLDPSNTALNWNEAEQRQEGALRPEAGRAIVNNFRWPRFVAWAPALGLGATVLLSTDASNRLTPDCTAAVKHVLQATWKPGETASAIEAASVVRAALPVLPAGAYSTSLGIQSPGNSAAGPALSFALLRGNDEGWLKLERSADARQFLHIHDPDQPSFPRACSSVTLQEDFRG